jgi:hypothetical protein
LFQEFTETLPCELQIPFRGPLGALLECVEYVDRLIELREVEDAMLKSRMHADLANAGSDRWHGFPVVRLEATLNPPKLESCHLSYIDGEAAQVVSGGPEPDHKLLRHAPLYKYRHVRSTTYTKQSPNLRLERAGDEPRRRACAPIAAGRSAANR